MLHIHFDLGIYLRRIKKELLSFKRTKIFSQRHSTVWKIENLLSRRRNISSKQNNSFLFLVKTIVSRNFSYTTICSSHQALHYHHLKNISSNQLMHMQLFSRNFCHKIVKVKFRQFHNTVFLHNIIIFL